MRDALRVPLAIVVGVLVVTAGAFGGAFLSPGVDSFEDASDRVVSTADGQALIVAAGVAAGAGFVAGTVASHYLTDDVNTSKLEELDALETKVSLHETAATQQQNTEIISDSFSNYLEDTRSIALMEGKNAYIKELNNGSSQAVAESAATQAVSRYYAVKQKQLIASWNTSTTVFQNGREVAKNTSGIDNQTFVSLNASTGVSVDHQETVFLNQSVTLVNATTEPVVAVRYHGYDGAADQNETATVNTGAQGTTGSSSDVLIRGYDVAAPNENYEKVEMVKFDQYGDRWTKIETQNSEVQDQLDTYIANTYDSYQTGEINSSDLVDPYLGAREYSPDGEFQSWALSSLSSMGVEPPENLSNIGEMEVTDLEDDVTYNGILMSQETPEGGYEMNTTYDASAINGTQMVLTDDDNSPELEGEFIVKSATNADGEEYAENESITYRNIEYNTTSTDEYQDLMQNLTELSAEIEAKQQQERGSGGGGGLFPGFGLGGIGGVGGVALIALAGAAFLVARD